MARVDRRVLVTGGASGIGRRISLAYAARGWDVLCHYRSTPDVATLAAQVAAHGATFEPLQADLTDPEALARLCDRIRAERLDALVNNAGTYVAPNHFTELSLADLEASLRLNAAAPALLAAAAFPGMRSRGFGRIVNVSSVAAKYGGSAHSLHYGMAKRALEGITLTLGREGAADNVLVNTVRPGVVDTDFHARFPRDMARRIAMIPARRMAQAEEVARVVAFLGSEENAFVTRECLAVAGGE